MTNARKKSSGWRPADKRYSPKEWHARRVAARVVEVRRDCDQLRLWRYCPARPCRRVRGCSGDPWQCMERRRPQIPQMRSADARAEPAQSPATATVTTAPRSALSASEAAAAIAASIADVMQPGSLAGEGLEAIVRDGRMPYEPRRKA